MLSRINHQIKPRSMGLRSIATGFSLLLCMCSYIPQALAADLRPFLQKITRPLPV